MVLDRSINITFHGIGEPLHAVDPAEQRVWVGKERFLSLLDSLTNRDDIAITFDDGNRSDIEHALPALRERGLTATFFVVVGRLGAPRFVDERDVQEIAAAGMEIGSHGMRHRAWRGLSDQALYEELVDAKRLLERVVDKPITRAACPFGSYDRRVLRTLRLYRYRQVYTSDRGTARPSDFLQARNSVASHDGPAFLQQIDALESTQCKALCRRAKRVVKRWR